MANELRVGIALSFSKGGASVIRSVSNEVTVTGDSYISAVQEIDTTEEVLVEPDALGSPGYVYVKNLDGTNYIEVGITGSYTIKLLAGQSAIFPAAAAIYAKANTAKCNLEYIIIEL